MVFEIFFALLSYIGWGTGDIFGTIATRKIGAYSATLWSYILRLLAFGLYIPIGLASLSNLTANLLVLNIILGVILLISFIAFNEALRIANPAIVGTIAASFAALVVVLSLIFLGESLSLLQAVAIIVIFGGVILATLNITAIKTGKAIINKGILLAIVAMICWGIYFTFIKIPVRSIGWFWPNYISFALFPLILLFTNLRGIKLHKPTFKSALAPLLFAVILTGIAEFSFNFAISKGSTAVIAPIAGSYPTLFVALSSMIFKDPITWQQKLGVITTLIGIVLLSVFSVM
jgi:transporter family protein